MPPQVPALGLALSLTIGVIVPAGIALAAAMPAPAFSAAQAASGVASPGDVAMEERMRRRFPQPVRVGDLIGLPLLDDNARTLGYVRQVVRTSQNRFELIVAYNDLLGWFGWNTRPVAVPIEAVGIAGRQLSSLDMPRSEFAVAPTWQQTNEITVAAADSINVALSRH
jgi:hypothetical protein